MSFEKRQVSENALSNVIIDCFDKNKLEFCRKLKAYCKTMELPQHKMEN